MSSAASQSRHGHTDSTYRSSPVVMNGDEDATTSEREPSVDLPYLRSEATPSSSSVAAPASSKDYYHRSTSPRLPTRSSTVNFRATNGASSDAAGAVAGRDLPPPRGTVSASGHSPPRTPLYEPSAAAVASSSVFARSPAAPHPGPPSRSASGSDENARSLGGHQAGSTISSHSSSNTTANSTSQQSCAQCGLPMTGQFVRALGTVYHLDCFRCKDCNDVVAQKFFPIDDGGKQYPLCERDYFSRLNLICAKCDQALRGSYITACNKKYHVEHFTCSICTTLFGPQDSYYEHENDVYCHYHYSTRFATKCVGCSSAILKQFVEINRNSRDECWHPECYMIHKFWNIKVVSRPSPTPAIADDPSNPSAQEPPSPWALEESQETHASLKEKQEQMEQKVYRIWTHLSAFEESSAACISDMLRFVSSTNYLDAIRMAEKFILHVEVLFATIDDLEACFAVMKNKGMSHVREARMLCRKTVDLFTLLSRIGETGTNERMGMTQDLLALVTGLAHYLKILIRIALTGALKLDRDFGFRGKEALFSFLDKLQLLASGGGNPSARRVVPVNRTRTIVGGGDDGDGSAIAGPSGTQGVSYGYKSLAPENAGESPFGGKAAGPNGTGSLAQSPPSDLCLRCGKTVEEDCVRLGTYQRWHAHCVTCLNCGRAAGEPSLANKEKEKLKSDGEGAGTSKENEVSKPAPTPRRPPPKVHEFLYTTDAAESEVEKVPPKAICCVDHPIYGARSGFAAVSRLEQFAFLLNVALRRLYLLLLRRGVIPLSSLSSSSPSTSTSTTPRNSIGSDSAITPMKTVGLDRKLSANARLPKRSMVVESPAGRIAQPTDVQHGGHRHTSGAGPGAIRAPGGVGDKKPAPPAKPTALPSSAAPKPAAATDVKSPPHSASTVIRPPFARNNTHVTIIDDVNAAAAAAGGAGPSSSSAHGHEFHRRPSGPVSEEQGITLGDIPQLLESEQAREQHRALPRQAGKLFVAELTPLELIIAKHFAVIALQRSPLREHFELDDILDLIEGRKSTFWKKIFKGKDTKDIKKKGVFGVPIELLVERDGADSMLGASRAALRIPSFVDEVLSAMKQMDMSVEGIFRKNGNIRRLKELSDAIDRDPTHVDLTSDNAVQLAALLKKFLREMPEPLLTYKLHRLFIASQTLPSEAERHRFLHLVTLLLPKPQRDTMEALFVFLKWVALFSQVDAETGNKMDLQNLAMMICPNILYAKGQDAARDQSFSAIQVVTFLMEEQDDFFTLPDELMPFLRDQEYFNGSTDLPSKDVHRKCESYLRAKYGKGGTPAPDRGLTVANLPPTNGPFSPSAMDSYYASSPLRSGPRSEHEPPTRGRPPVSYFASADNVNGGGRSSPRSQSQSRPIPSGPSSHSSHGHGSPSSPRDPSNTAALSNGSSPWMTPTNSSSPSIGGRAGVGAGSASTGHNPPWTNTKSNSRPNSLYGDSNNAVRPSVDYGPATPRNGTQDVYRDPVREAGR